MKKRKNHSPEFKAKVALEAIREEMTLANIQPERKVVCVGVAVSDVSGYGSK